MGIAVVGAIFYALINSQHIGLLIQRTIGPYSDTLAEHGFASTDPDIWQNIAGRHEVAIILHSSDGEVVAWDNTGRPVDAGQALKLGRGLISAGRSSGDGRRVTFVYSLWSFRSGHHQLLIGLAVMVVVIVGSAFWFLNRQLRPLAWLHSGVEAVARGDFKARVPVVRNDEIGRVAEAFNVMTSRIGEMIDDRERLLADVSHELRSPIARMKVALELMPEGDKREALARDVKEMESLIAVLLEREALRSRAGRFEGEQIDVRGIAGQVVAAFADQGPGVEFVCDSATPLHADPELIKLLIQNLVDNAVKFSYPDSEPVVVKLETDDDQVVLRVTDDGIGIPQGSEDQLFKPFVKGDPARGHGVGYGIGLSLCQRIVQLHGGSIRLQARAPRGTDVVVTLGSES